MTDGENTQSIDELKTLIVAMEDPYDAWKPIAALAEIGTPEAMQALFDVYPRMNTWEDSVAHIEILDGIEKCDIYGKASRDIAYRHRTLLHQAIDHGVKDDWPELWGNAIRILWMIVDKSPETIRLIQPLATEHKDDPNSHPATNSDRKRARQTAIFALQGLAPDVVSDNEALARLYARAMYGENDPIWFCNVCRWRFPRPKEVGDICDDCGAEFGVDDDHHYRRPPKNDS